MATTPYPLPRETRESEIDVGDGTAGPYGPTTFKVFDILDVEVWAKADGEDFFSDVTGDVTVAKTADAGFDTVSVTFDDAVPATTEFVIRSARTHERSVAVTRGGAIDSDQLEKELSRQGSVLEELRRDISRTVQTDPGVDPVRIAPGAAGMLVKYDADGNLVDSGENVDSILGSTAAAATWRDFARKWATEAEDTEVADTVNPAGYSAFHWARKALAYAGSAASAAGTAVAAAAAAAASAAGVNLPAIQPGDAGKQLYVNGGETGYLLDDPVSGGGGNFVADRTALKALDTTVVTECYLTEAEREGQFLWRAGDYSAHVTADTLEGIYIKATAIAASSGAWVRAVNAPAEVKWWGAVADGATDDTAAIQAALDLVGLMPGSIVALPAGELFVTDTLTINKNKTYLRGKGMYQTTLVRSGDYGHTLDFTGNDGTGVYLTDIGLRGIGFKSTGLMTSGAHVNWNGVSRVECGQLYMLNGFIGMQCAGLTAAHISDWYLVFADIFGGSASGRKFLYCKSAAGTYGHPHCGDVFFEDINVRGNDSSQVTQYGIQIDTADGIWFNGGHIGNGVDANLFMSHVGGEPLHLVWFNNVMFDHPFGDNHLFANSDASTEAYEIHFVNCTLKGAGTGNNGVYMAGDFWNVSYTGGSIEQHSQYGYYGTSADNHHVRLVNVNIFGNSYGNSNVYSGVRLEAGVGDFSMIGGSSGGSDGSPTATGATAWGVILAASFGDNILFEGVDLRRNATGSISVPYASPFGDVRFVNNRSQDTITVASATGIGLPPNADLIKISGTATITNINPSWPGRRVTLVFASTATLADGVNLKLASNLVATADDAITLVCDGTNWFECGRSVN